MDSQTQRSPEEFVKYLDEKVNAMLSKVEGSEVYRLVSDPKTDRRLVAAIVKYILLEVFSYGPHVTEATFVAIGRMPKNRPDLIRPMILHDVSEVDHGEMALKDFVKLGGDESWARSRRITPASFAMGATCRALAQLENPFCYLGYMYLFECLTPILTERAQTFLEAAGFPTAARKFIDVHAKEDIAHADALGKLVERVVRDYPDAASAIDYGFNCFSVTYPLLIWEVALQQARAEVAARAQAG